ETLVIPLPRKNQPSRRTDGNNHPLPNPHPAAASSSYRANRIASEQTAPPANAELAADPPHIRPLLSLKPPATNSIKSPYPELVGRGSVQRRFLQRPPKSVLYPDHDHGVAETSPFGEIADAAPHLTPWVTLSTAAPSPSR